MRERGMGGSGGIGMGTWDGSYGGDGDGMDSDSVGCCDEGVVGVGGSDDN